MTIRKEKSPQQRWHMPDSVLHPSDGCFAAEEQNHATGV
jgi:hypothetical protein